MIVYGELVDRTLRCAQQEKWFADIAEIVEMRAPPGTAGASATEKFMARLETAAQLASVLSESIALDRAGGTVNTCELRITDERGSRRTVRSHPASRVHSDAQGRAGQAAVRADLDRDQPDRRRAELRMIDAPGQ
jgi:hypothetical protein